MHIFNMSTTGMQGFKQIHLKLWEELIIQTLYHKALRADGQIDGHMDRQRQISMPPDYRHGGQTCYPTLKANLKIILSRKCRDLVKNYLFVCKHSHAHLQNIHNKYAWFQNDPLKTVREVDYTNSIPYNAKVA